MIRKITMVKNLKACLKEMNNGDVTFLMYDGKTYSVNCISDDNKFFKYNPIEEFKFGEKPVIYIIRCKPNNKIYVGKAKSNVSQRWAGHKCSLRKGDHWIKTLQDDWNEYGEDAFEFLTIETLENDKNIYDREQYWMDYYQSYDSNKGYNLSKKSRSYLTGGAITKEHLDKMISSRKPGYATGNNNANTKLTEQEVYEILEKLKNGIPGIELSKEYNISPTIISMIKNGKHWVLRKNIDK